MNINKIKLIGLFSFCSLILGSDNIFITNYNESDTIYFSNEKYTQISNSKNILELYDILSDDYSKYEMKIIKEHIFSNEEFSNFAMKGSVSIPLGHLNQSSNLGS